jgi:hypothetical protein
VGTGALFREESCSGLKFNSHLYLAPRLRMSGAVPLLPFCAFMAL